MRATKRMKKAVSSLLALTLVLSYVPLPTLAEEGCTHHVHDESCGYGEGVPCTFDPAACSECEAVEEETLCTCESEDGVEHAPFCDLYVRTYEECKCVLDCAEEGLNDWCETCHFEGVESCTGGEEEQTPYAVIEGHTGQCNWTFDEESGKLTISGNGNMGSNQPWSSYTSSITAVVIESGVITIGSSAFYGCSSLTTVTIPASVTTIGDYAFYDCSSLTTVFYYGEKEPTAGSNVFTNCPRLTITVPNNYGPDKETFCGIDVIRDSSTPEPTTYTVTATASPAEGGTVTGGGSYEEGAAVTLTATPAEGYQFKEWKVISGGVTITDNKFTMPANDVTVNAVFQKKVVEYPVWVAGKQVTSENQNDVLGNEMVSYNPATFTLTLNNASISTETGAAIHSTYEDYTLNIVGTGTNTISAAGGFGIYATKQNISISGGNFVITGSTNGIVTEKGSLTVEKGAQIKAVGTDKGTYAQNGTTVENGGLLSVTGNKAVVRGSYTMGTETFETLSVTENAVLNISENQTVTVNTRITSSGSINIEGTLKVPAGSGKTTMTGGTLYIGEKGYRWDSQKNAYICMEHDWNYTVSGAAITADCGSCNIGEGTMTISAADGTYNGDNHTAECTSENWKGDEVTIVYAYKQTENDSYAVAAETKNAGFYKASITAGGVTAFVEYEVTPKDLTIQKITATDRVYAPGNTDVDISEVVFNGIVTGDIVTATAAGTIADANAGTDKPVSVTITLSGDAVCNYSYPTTAATTVTIQPRSLNADGITAALSDNLIFEGAAIPVLTIKDGATTLNKDTDYTVTQTGGEGLFTLTVVGKGNYKDTYSGSLTYLVVTLPDPDKTAPDDKAAIDAYDRYTELNKTYEDAELAQKLSELQKALTAYDVIEGHKASYTKGSGKTFTITANGYFGKFIGLEVDGKTLDTKYYTAQSGSTIVTLKNSYLDSLSDGKHTIAFLYTDGSTGGDHYFRIASNNGSPFTGDNNHMMMLTGIMMTSLLCMAAMVMLAPRKKGKYEQ